jgi:hypothetical protein
MEMKEVQRMETMAKPRSFLEPVTDDDKLDFVLGMAMTKK